MKILLLPLDERPVNTVYPQMIARIAGASVLLPDVLSSRREPAPIETLIEWLSSNAADCDAIIVSIEMLGYGGLIASRISHDPTSTILARLDGLRRIKQQHPTLPVYGFNVITRVSNANNATEEPLYWNSHGTRLYRYSQLMDRQQQGHDVLEELEQLRQALPSEIIADFTRRRLRNHIINLHVLELLADNVFDLLVLSSDDTSEYGFGSQEKAWLQTWVQRLPQLASRIIMYPGADEVGCVLLMRALGARSQPPTFYVHYAIDKDRTVIAPYEDSPIHVTVERQIRALGGIQVENDTADFIVAVNPPSRLRSEYDSTHPDFVSQQARRAPFLRDFVDQIGQWLQNGRRVILADVAYPNGSDPDLIHLLLDDIDLSQLAAYGAWNTAGNTIGTALAHGTASLHITQDTQRQAHQQFLLHRFIEDWAYQHVVRQKLRDWLKAETGSDEITPNTEQVARRMILEELTNLLPRLGTLGQNWRIRNIRLPWQRLFEVDFDLEPR